MVTGILSVIHRTFIELKCEISIRSPVHFVICPFFDDLVFSSPNYQLEFLTSVAASSRVFSASISRSASIIYDPYATTITISFIWLVPDCDQIITNFLEKCPNYKLRRVQNC